MKRCIFHYPEPIIECPKAGSALRPRQMLKALEAIGYQVDCVSGYSKDRKKKIQSVKKNILNGVKYDFLYSESVNSPTILADKDHLPRHPFMDFQFLRYCKGKNIPVGLFYRDVYWKFPSIFNFVTTKLKRSILIPMFRYDVTQYPSCINLLYLPTLRMQNYVLKGLSSAALPPGGILHNNTLSKKRNFKPLKDNILRIFYVGSLSNLYDNRMLFQSVKETDNVFLTVCTHESQWEKCFSEYKPYLCDRIKIVHESSEQLEKFYEEADVAACCLNRCDYLDMAMPIKIFEAISYGTPLLVTECYSIAQLVHSNNIGWVCKNSVSGIKDKLNYLKNNRLEISEKTNNTITFAYKNTWEERARQISNELSSLKR